MLPEITIKISFAPAPGGDTASTGASVEIAPPELREQTALADVPPPPQVPADSGDSFAYDVPPPPAALLVEDAVPPTPNAKRTKDVSKDADEPPPPSRTKGSRNSK
jgi:hypothetical protein